MHLTTITGFILCLNSSPLQVYGQYVASLLGNRTNVIENFIMKGHGKGWISCDILSVEPLYPRLKGNRPEFAIGLTALREFDISSRLKQSSCLLLTAHITNMTILSTIIEFGWSVIQFKRLGVVMTMGPNITLGMAKNTTNLPYMIAAKLHDGKSQFLCPAVGKHMPMRQSSMCGEPLTTHKGKTIRVGVYGIWPWVIPGGQDGVDIRLLKFLEEKLELKANIEYITSNQNAAFEMVR